MQFLGSRLFAIPFAVISSLIQIANLFVGNIVIFEASTGIAFQWGRLLQSRFFWVVIVLQVVYFFFCFIYNQHAAKTDDEVSKAIDKNIIKLYKVAGKRTIQCDFENANKTLLVIEEMEKRRNKDGK